MWVIERENGRWVCIIVRKNAKERNEKIGGGKEIRGWITERNERKREQMRR